MNQIIRIAARHQFSGNSVELSLLAEKREVQHAAKAAMKKIRGSVGSDQRFNAVSGLLYAYRIGSYASLPIWARPKLSKYEYLQG